MNTTFVVIPAYNEGGTIQNVVREAKKKIDNIIVVDDGSQDSTMQMAQEAGALVLSHRVNLGKGAALKTGCDYAVRKGADRIIVMDGDGQHDPSEISSFLSSLDHHDIVFGFRTVPKTMPLVMLLGNKLMSRALQLMYGINIKDSQCGYRGFTVFAYAAIKWDALDYYIETEMIVRSSKSKLIYTQVPIKTIYNDNYKGTTVVDGMVILIKMMGWRIFK
jgi:glycosyltransferase involved in cell wall biosynthesis